jgi:hypothetical protein
MKPGHDAWLKINLAALLVKLPEASIPSFPGPGAEVRIFAVRLQGGAQEDVFFAVVRIEIGWDQLGAQMITGLVLGIYILSNT